MSNAEANPKGNIKKWLIRLAGSAFFLFIVFSLLPTEEVFSALRGLSPTVWISALAIFLSGHIAAALKWRLLINIENSIAPVAAIRAHFAGLAANLCLPGVAGGDVVRAGLIMRGAERQGHVAVGSIFDRALDTLGLMIIAFLGGLWAVGRETLGGPYALIFIAAILTPLAGIGAYLFIRQLNITKITKLTAKIDELLITFMKSPGKLSFCLLLSMSIQSAFILTTIMLARAANADATPAEWFFAWPLAKVAAILPISLAGLGLREAGLAAILSGLGADASRVVAASLLWQSVLFAGGLIGGALLLASGGVKASPHSLSPTDQIALNKGTDHGRS